MGRKSRNTKQKEIVAEEISKLDSSFDVESIWELAKKRDSNIGIATVYRHLREAVKKGSLFKYSCNGKSIYSRKSVSHCHFECEKTGKVFHFELDDLSFLQKKVPGKIKSVQLEVKGICDDCSS